jgi:SAM-dependent methyltransferase
VGRAGARLGRGDGGPNGWGIPVYERILERVPIHGSTRLLDVGCGAGRFCRIARDRGATVVGLDATSELIEIAKEGWSAPQGIGFPTEDGNSPAGRETLDRLRAGAQAAPAGVTIGGEAAQGADFLEAVYGNFRWWSRCSRARSAPCSCRSRPCS